MTPIPNAADNFYLLKTMLARQKSGLDLAFVFSFSDLGGSKSYAF